MVFSIQRYNCCKQISRRILLLLSLIITSLFSFSQQDTATDSATYVADDEDRVVETIDTSGHYLDSLNKAEHNYYNDTSYWAKDTFLIRKVPDDVVKELQQQDAFWYANKDFRKNNEAEPRGMNMWAWLAGQKWYRVLAWTIIIGGFVTVMLWYLASSNVRLFQRRPVAIEETQEGDGSENIFDINYQKEIEKAISENNYRLAIRLMFLRVLKNMAHKNVIQYKQEQTNLDYLMQLHNTGYYKDFFRITRHYEYAWYGQFDVSNSSFVIIKKEFENFDRQFY